MDIELIYQEFLRSGLKRLTYRIIKSSPYLINYSKTVANSEVEQITEKAFKVKKKHAQKSLFILVIYQLIIIFK
jgi:hypothetical protein